MVRQGPIIDIYPFNGRSVSVVPTGAKLTLRGELEVFIEENWRGKEKWDNAWIPLVSRIDVDDVKVPENVTIRAGAMSFKQTNGILQTIDRHLPFAPEGIPNLSLGIIPITSDGYTMISRRSPKQPHAPGVWNFNGGYMSSRFIDRPNCSDSRFARDSRVFSIQEQLSIRAKNQDYQGVNPEDIEFSQPITLAYGLLHSNEMEMGIVAKIAKTKNEMEKALKDFEDQNGKEHSEVQYPRVEDLLPLIRYQANLVGTDSKTYSPRNPRELLLLDDNVGELIGGVYEAVTKTKLPEDTIPYLNKHGWRISVKEMFDGKGYDFARTIRKNLF